MHPRGPVRIENPSLLDGVAERSSRRNTLGLDRVLALEHVVNLLQVVGAGGDGGDLALGSVVLLKVGLLAEVAHLPRRLALVMAGA